MIYIAVILIIYITYMIYIDVILIIYITYMIYIAVILNDISLLCYSNIYHMDI